VIYNVYQGRVQDDDGNCFYLYQNFADNWDSDTRDDHQMELFENWNDKLFDEAQPQIVLNDVFGCGLDE